jgi:hypothetical protein
LKLAYEFCKRHPFHQDAHLHVRHLVVVYYPITSVFWRLYCKL